MALAPLVKKEFKELVRDPRIILPIIIIPLILFPLMGGIVGQAQKRANRGGFAIGVMDLDGTNESKALVQFLEAQNLTVLRIPPQDPLSALNLTLDRGGKALLVIERGFSTNLTRGNATATIYIVWQGGMMSTMSLLGRIESSLRAFKEFWLYNYVRALGGQPGSIGPIRVEGTLVARGGEIRASQEVLYNLLQSWSLIPIIGLIIMSVVMQVIATSIASEKENKTLETLLSLPISRMNIMLAKIVGPSLVALLSAVIYVVGMRSYFSQVVPATGSPGILSVMGATNLALYGLVIATSVFAMSTIAIIIAAFAEDVRGATSMVGAVYIVIFIPAFAVMLLGGSIGRGAYVMMHAIPSTILFTAMDNMIVGNYGIVFSSLVYNVVFSAAMIWLGARILGSEKIFTARKFRGLRLKLI